MLDHVGHGPGFGTGYEGLTDTAPMECTGAVYGLFVVVVMTPPDSTSPVHPYVGPLVCRVQKLSG